MRLKEYLSHEELQILDEELFCISYHAILQGKWPYLDEGQIRKWRLLNPADRQQAAIAWADDYLADLPEWTLSTYFARYGSQYLPKARAKRIHS